MILSDSEKAYGEGRGYSRLGMSLGKALKWGCMISGIPVVTVFVTGHSDRPTQIVRTSFQGSVIVKSIMSLSKSCLPLFFFSLCLLL